MTDIMICTDCGDRCTTNRYGTCRKCRTKKCAVTRCKTRINKLDTRRKYCAFHTDRILKTKQLKFKDYETTGVIYT